MALPSLRLERNFLTFCFLWFLFELHESIAMQIVSNNYTLGFHTLGFNQTWVQNGIFNPQLGVRCTPFYTGT